MAQSAADILAAAAARTGSTETGSATPTRVVEQVDPQTLRTSAKSGK